MEDEDPTYVEFLTKSANEISLFWNDLDYERNAFIFAFRLYLFLIIGDKKYQGRKYP